MAASSIYCSSFQRTEKVKKAIDFSRILKEIFLFTKRCQVEKTLTGFPLIPEGLNMNRKDFIRDCATPPESYVSPGFIFYKHVNPSDSLPRKTMMLKRSSSRFSFQSDEDRLK